MSLQRHSISIESGGQPLHGHVVEGAALGPGVLFVHGWDSDRHHYEDLSDRVAALGCTCMSFDMRGHGEDVAEHDEVTREHNLTDVIAAYDALSRWQGVRDGSIGIVGTSYGGYLAAIASTLRPVERLALRVPALYPDAQWQTPKNALDKQMLRDYRSRITSPEGNRALEACRAFQGDVLVVESGDDRVALHPGVRSFVDAFAGAQSMKHEVIGGADHQLSSPAHQRNYADLLLSWIESTGLPPARNR